MAHNPVMVTGMFRSGTTLVSALLGAHPEIAAAADSFLPVLKEFRNEVHHSLESTPHVDPYAPLDDYYFYPYKQRVMEAVQATGFDLSCSSVDLDRLRKDVADYSAEYSPWVAKHVDSLEGSTFRDVFELN